MTRPGHPEGVRAGKCDRQASTGDHTTESSRPDPDMPVCFAAHPWVCGSMTGEQRSEAGQLGLCCLDYLDLHGLAVIA